MICPKCHTRFELPANCCPNCGVSLQRSGGRVLVITAIFVLAIISGVYGYVRYRFAQEHSAAHRIWAGQPKDAASEYQTSDSRLYAPEALQPSEPLLPIRTANFTLTDITGRDFMIYPVVILSHGWFAFPKRPCIGGHTWRVALENRRVVEVQGGIQRDADPVGLWQLPVDADQNKPALMPWSPDQPLTWQPLDRPQVSLRVSVRNSENLSDFVRIPFEADESGPGIFVQNGKIVGWSFDELITGGFLWTGNPGSDLIPAFYVDDFYRLTFANGREEALLIALADENLSDLKRLEALADAYRLEPRLAENETPEIIRPAEIHAHMRKQIERIKVRGQAEDLLPLFDPQTILTLNNPDLTADLVAVGRDLGEYTYALELIEILQEETVGDTEQRLKLKAMQSMLYREWLNRLIADGDNHTARQAYQEANDRFPQDPTIHLAGVELALQVQDWALAERLLAARNYPPDLQRTVGRLRREISDLKSQEGQIIIRFRPSSGTIPVIANLDRDLSQRFIIDTGASLVTVPTATVRQLGIDLSYNLPRRLFYSATGVQNAIEVTLPYIELNGWTINNVRALVVDLPGQPEVGLLGMNYLKNFRMDVNSKKGLLLLKPR